MHSATQQRTVTGLLLRVNRVLSEHRLWQFNRRRGEVACVAIDGIVYRYSGLGLCQLVTQRFFGNAALNA